MSLARTPTGRPSIRASAVTISGREALAQERDRAGVGQRLDRSARRRRRGARARARRRAAAPGRAPRQLGAGALEVAEQALGHRGRLGLVGDHDVDDAVGRLHRHRADVVGRDDAEPAALDHRRPAHAERDVLGRHDQVRAAGDHGVAGEAAPGDDGDPRHHARQPRPQRERARVAARRRPGWSVSPGRPPPPSAKKTVGSRMRSISSNSRSFLRWPSAPCVPASTV